ncbi:guanitoxin biosynthesis heme-dependent pre-guanitoxin N-hydroxylase GntA [Gillisia marina]|uniref:guanitoxin biosynthesis heme-dependent pre-guanitoxin N-hydroxylase GntA n=1 Tax=Gillisia marina TaxID=1167637 RepID=UPI00029A001C|nr:guanitoxin biosynthesis heme-dependent pre-guanitoxin N-hydroxylase GntA [Gillisia marina]
MISRIEKKIKKEHENLNDNKVIKAQFSNFILEQNHPCMMAQTVFSMDKVDFHTYENFGSKNTAQKILEDLKIYIANYDFESNDFLTFLAVFKGSTRFSEAEFETVLWKQLNFLNELDTDSWDPAVSEDPTNKNFSFSLGGKAFYIVGLHPDSSRIARQSPYPAMAFNLHWQFEKLREMNTYETVRDKIRERDIELQGSINPMLNDFGETSEAKQYSGKKVGKDWECPFLSGKM